MKIISFSIFDEKKDWQFLFYLRGLWFNTAMASLVYPDWKIRIAVEGTVVAQYGQFFSFLAATYNVEYGIYTREPLCKMMLWRMDPIFSEGVDRVICRDADALVTYREAQAVEEWIRSERAVHSIHDNTAHNVPLLGGMCGFMTGPIKAKYGSYETMIGKSPVRIKEHGSDQQFLTQVLYEDFKDSMMLHNFKGLKVHCAEPMNHVDEKPIEGVSEKLWTSNLCVDFIGSAGCKEMETLRFLRDHGIDLSLGGIGKQLPQIFYWL